MFRLKDVALGSGWGAAGCCRADPRAWAGLMDGGEKGGPAWSPTFLGSSHLEIDSNIEMTPLTLL